MMNEFSNKKLLLVDDEPNILVPIEFLMKQQGFVVEKAFNGQEALDKMKNYTPDIVILDVMMPKMNGFEVAKHIRANEKFTATQIIFLTAKGTTQDKDTGYSAGGEVYLTKPFDNDELVSIVTEMAAYG
ncbi:MAG: response regulator [Bacteroidota bacterium]